MQLPDYMIVKTFEWESMRDVISSESTNGIILQKVRTGHRWDSRMRIEILPVDTRKARGFLFSLQEDGAVLEYTDPDWITSVASRSGSGLSNGVTSVTVASTAGIEAGMMFNFSNHTKLYMVTSVTAGSINFMPEYVGDGATATVSFAAPTLTSELHPDYRQATGLNQTMIRDLTRMNLRLVESIG